MTILQVEHAEASVDKKKIICVPMRFVRTNRGVLTVGCVRRADSSGRDMRILPSSLYRTDRSHDFASRRARGNGGRGQPLLDRFFLRCAHHLPERCGHGTGVAHACTSRGSAWDWRISTCQNSGATPDPQGRQRVDLSTTVVVPQGAGIFAGHPW